MINRIRQRFPYGEKRLRETPAVLVQGVRDP